jgi:hypothetical protein
MSTGFRGLDPEEKKAGFQEVRPGGFPGGEKAKHPGKQFLSQPPRPEGLKKKA